jgi:hypothetical protein
VNGWVAFAAAIGLPSAAAPIIVAVLLAPLAAVALLSLFLPGSRRAIPAMIIALLGFGTAVIGAHIEVSIAGATTIPVWPAAGLSLYWLGLLGAAVTAFDALGRAVTVPALVVGIAGALVAAPFLAAPIAGTSPVSAAAGRLLPAFVTAEAAQRPTLGTLELVPQDEGGISATIHRGAGTTLDEQSTLAATATGLSTADKRLATLAGNIASKSGFDIPAELNALQVGFVLVPATSSDAAAATRQRVSDALDGNRDLTPVGSTANGYLWHFADLQQGTPPTGPGPLGTTYGLLIVIGQAVVFGLTLLLAVPTARRRRVRPTTGASGSDEPAGTFEDDNA